MSTRELPDDVLLEYFNRSLDTVNNGVAEQHIRGGIMRQPLDIALGFLDEMTKINRAWYTREDRASFLNIGLTKEQLGKNQERDENMAKIMTQMDLLTKNVMGGGYKDMNTVGANSGVSPDDAQFEDMYNVEVQFLSNQTGGSRPSYPRSGGNHGGNRDRDDDMARSKLLVRGLAPGNKAKGKGINSTHLTSSESEREEDVESRTPIHTLAIEGEFLKRKRLELESKVVRDPLARLPALPTPPTPLISYAPEVLLAPAHPPWSMNRLKATGLWNILKEKPLSTDGVVKSDLCRRAGVPFVAKMDVEVTSTSSTDIRRIEAEYMKDEAERRKKASVDISLVVDVESMEADTTQSTLENVPVDIPNPSTSTAPPPATTFRPPLT
ncbi:hypothetical protein MTR67_035293 [Solanum verrucosum]|uniref:Uncharacterized protein n=1 Tax=Solanum verrucosum TaxID=315347 RepID=A0AAF0U9V9_SOLVR|nr:hypothetical protein MTR67_035293 [Solanum verrucosum]